MPKKSISKIVIRAMSVRLFFVILLAAIGGYWNNYRVIKGKTINELEEYVNERVQRETIRFELAQENIELLVKEFRTAMLKPSFPFKINFEDHDNESGRRSLLKDEQREALHIVSPGVQLNENDKKILALADKLLPAFGYPWKSSFSNLWLVIPDKSISLYWPQKAHKIFPSPKSNFYREEWISVGLPKNNPLGKMRWAGPYYDLSNEWLVSVNYPFYLNGVYQFSLGLDINMEKFSERARSNFLEGSYNVIVTQEGRLIYHPRFEHLILRPGKKLFLKDFEKPHLLKIHQRLIENPGRVIDAHELDSFIANGVIQGPRWLLLMVYPKSNLTFLARETAYFVAITGLISLLVEILIIFQVFKRFVSNPIQRLITTAKSIASGDTRARTEIRGDDEIGQLAQSFDSMSDKIMERDEELVSQANKLELLVTERTRELDLQRAKAYQSARMATLGEMSGGIAHEINNPLSVITLSAESIKKHLQEGLVKPEKILFYTDKILKTSGRISKIVTGMKSFTKDRKQQSKELVFVNSIIENVLTISEDLLSKNNIEVEKETVPDVRVFCQEGDLTQALLNLLQNSVDALATVPNKKISIRTVLDGNKVKIVLEDNGPGIAEKDASKIMDPFFTTKEVGKGTGLGLFISLGLVEANSGKLYLDHSSPNTRFVIELPIAV